MNENMYQTLSANCLQKYRWTVFNCVGELSCRLANCLDSTWTTSFYQNWDDVKISALVALTQRHLDWSPSISLILGGCLLLHCCVVPVFPGDFFVVFFMLNSKFRHIHPIWGNDQNWSSQYLYIYTRDYQRTSRVTQMIKDLNWRTLEQRCIDSRLTLMYKITYDLVAIHAADYLIPNSNTRQSRHNHLLAYRQIQTLKDY